MKSLYSLLTLLFLSGGALHAEQIFVLFDGSCGERVRYEQAVANQPRMDYFSYNFTMPGGSKLILETGSEGAVTQSYLPQGYLYCNDPRLNTTLADRVNGGVDRVFVLLPVSQNQFLVQPVTMAATLQRNGAEQFTYQSPLTAFQFDTKNGIIGVNLSYDRPANKVYFEGRDNNSCNGVYLFRQLSVGSAYPVIDYKIVPELGVTERRLGSDGRTTSGGVIEIRDVNGQDVEQYLASICASATAQVAGTAPAPAPNVYGNQAPAPPMPNVNVPVQPESQAYNPAAPAPVTTTNVTHTVAKGETLYAISRKYNTSVGAIQTANGMSGSTLYPGQQLTVSTTTAAPTTAPAVAMAPPTTTVPTMPYNPGNVANSNAGASYPTPYGGQPAAPTAYDGGTARGGEPVYGEDIHIVQPGETVASVALKYGYTSAKFREMNELGSNDVIRVGERLKTSACNCPAAQPTAAPANDAIPPATYGTIPNAPQPYQAPAPALTPYQAPVQAAGTQIDNSVPAYRAPSNYNAPAAAPAPGTAPAPTRINNDPNFGQVVPNVSAAPNTTLSNLESRSPTPAPATYGSYPSAPQPYQAPAANSPAPTPYGGVPVGANIDYNQPNTATQPAVNRSFHLVQEGESLFSIAQRYGMSVEQLRGINQLAPTEVIVPFQKLYLN